MVQQTLSSKKNYKSKIKINNKSRQAIDKTDIRHQIDKHVGALRSMDLDSVMSIYAPNIVSFDVDGTYLGLDAKRKA